jgi:hypothetical protein
VLYLVDAVRDPVARLLVVAELLDGLTVRLAPSVDRLRVEGLTWDEIGGLLGVTRQTAWERFGGRAPEADPLPPGTDAPQASSRPAACHRGDDDEGGGESSTRSSSRT